MLTDRVQQTELSSFEFWQPLHYNLQSKSNTNKLSNIGSILVENQGAFY